MAEILFKEESFAIIGACFEVYNDKGGGFHEGVYHECLEIELRMRGILWREGVTTNGSRLLLRF